MPPAWKASSLHLQKSLHDLKLTEISKPLPHLRAVHRRHTQCLYNNLSCAGSGTMNILLLVFGKQLLCLTRTVLFVGKHWQTSTSPLPKVITSFLTSHFQNKARDQQTRVQNQQQLSGVAEILRNTTHATSDRCSHHLKPSGFAAGYEAHDQNAN